MLIYYVWHLTVLICEFVLIFYIIIIRKAEESHNYYWSTSFDDTKRCKAETVVIAHFRPFKVSPAFNSARSPPSCKYRWNSIFYRLHCRRRLWRPIKHFPWPSVSLRRDKIFFRCKTDESWSRDNWFGTTDQSSSLTETEPWKCPSTHQFLKE